jgi:hypothetical protein
MVEIEIETDQLLVHVQGRDKLWALKSQLAIPLAHVTGAAPAGPDAHAKFTHWKTGGTQFPGVISAGRFHIDGQHVFMDVHDPAKAIEIGLRDDKYAKLVVEVADPSAELAKIQPPSPADVATSSPGAPEPPEP